MGSQKLMPKDLAVPWSKAQEAFEHNKERYLPKAKKDAKGRKGKDKKSKSRDKGGRGKGRVDKKNGKKGGKGGRASKGGKDKRDVTATDTATGNTNTNTNGTHLQRRTPDPPQEGPAYLQMLSQRPGQFPYPPQHPSGPYRYHDKAGEGVTVYLCNTGLNTNHPVSLSPLLALPHGRDTECARRPARHEPVAGETALAGHRSSGDGGRLAPQTRRRHDGRFVPSSCFLRQKSSRFFVPSVFMTGGTGTGMYVMAAGWDFGVVKKAEVVIVKWAFADEDQGLLHRFWPWTELGTILADVEQRDLQGKAVINIPWAGNDYTFSETLPSHASSNQLQVAHQAYTMLWASLLERASFLGVTVVVPTGSDADPAEPTGSDVGPPWPIYPPPPLPCLANSGLNRVAADAAPSVALSTPRGQ